MQMENRLQNTDTKYGTFPENVGKFTIWSSLTYCEALNYRFENLCNLLGHNKLDQKSDSKATSTIRRIETQMYYNQHSVIIEFKSNIHDKKD